MSKLWSVSKKKYNNSFISLYSSSHIRIWLVNQKSCLLFVYFFTYFPSSKVYLFIIFLSFFWVCDSDCSIIDLFACLTKTFPYASLLNTKLWLANANVGICLELSVLSPALFGIIGGCVVIVTEVLVVISSVYRVFKTQTSTNACVCNGLTDKHQDGGVCFSLWVCI